MNRLVMGGVRHSLPQEAPQAIAEAIVTSLKSDRRFGPVDQTPAANAAA
jgi:hypothetical protein